MIIFLLVILVMILFICRSHDTSEVDEFTEKELESIANDNDDNHGEGYNQQPICFNLTSISVPLVDQLMLYLYTLH